MPCWDCATCSLIPPPCGRLRSPLLLVSTRRSASCPATCRCPSPQRPRPCAQAPCGPAASPPTSPVSRPHPPTALSVIHRERRKANAMRAKMSRAHRQRTASSAVRQSTGPQVPLPSRVSTSARCAGRARASRGVRPGRPPRSGLGRSGPGLQERPGFGQLRRPSGRARSERWSPSGPPAWPVTIETGSMGSSCAP